MKTKKTRTPYDVVWPSFAVKLTFDSVHERIEISNTDIASLVHGLGFKELDATQEEMNRIMRTLVRAFDNFIETAWWKEGYNSYVSYSASSRLYALDWSNPSDPHRQEEDIVWSLKATDQDLEGLSLHDLRKKAKKTVQEIRHRVDILNTTTFNPNGFNEKILASEEHQKRKAKNPLGGVLQIGLPNDENLFIQIKADAWAYACNHHPYAKALGGMEHFISTAWTLSPFVSQIVGGSTGYSLNPFALKHGEEENKALPIASFSTDSQTLLSPEGIRQLENAIEVFFGKDAIESQQQIYMSDEIGFQSAKEWTQDKVSGYRALLEADDLEKAIPSSAKNSKSNKPKFL